MQKFRQRILQRFGHHHLGGQDIGANRPYPGAKVFPYKVVVRHREVLEHSLSVTD